MANDKLDWFPIYWQRFIIGTLEMNAEEIGAYILLLIHEWDKGFVPTNDRELRKISRLSSKKLVKVLEKFEKVGEKYFNSTLEIIRIEQTEKTNRRSESGKNAARIKYERIANAMKSQSESMPLEKKREEEKRIEEKREEGIAPELIFQYMIGGKEILSVEETFKENFPVLFTNFKIKHGDFKIKKWFGDFSDLHQQKSWKDLQDLRTHIASFIKIQSEKDNGATKKPNTERNDGKVGAFGKH